jgi:hypothetical protein
VDETGSGRSLMTFAISIVEPRVHSQRVRVIYEIFPVTAILYYKYVLVLAVITVLCVVTPTFLSQNSIDYSKMSDKLKLCVCKCVAMPSVEVSGNLALYY